MGYDTMTKNKNIKMKKVYISRYLLNTASQAYSYWAGRPLIWC